MQEEGAVQIKAPLPTEMFIQFEEDSNDGTWRWVIYKMLPRDGVRVVCRSERKFKTHEECWQHAKTFKRYMPSTKFPVGFGKDGPEPL